MARALLNAVPSPPPATAAGCGHNPDRLAPHQAPDLGLGLEVVQAGGHRPSGCRIRPGSCGKDAQHNLLLCAAVLWHADGAPAADLMASEPDAWRGANLAEHRPEAGRIHPRAPARIRVDAA
jgi:hypothetical protein